MWLVVGLFGCGLAGGMGRLWLCARQAIPICPYLLSSETTAKGTGLAESAGKEDPVELDSSLALWRDVRGVE